MAAIFEATAQLLDRSDGGRLSTNAIAERAGVSIGTLYQYFRDLDHLLLAMAERETSDVAARVLAGAKLEDAMDADQRIRLAVRALIGAFGGRQRARKRLMQALMARGLGDPLIETFRRTADALTAQPMADRHLGRLTLSPASGFVLTRAVMGVVRAAVLEEAAVMKTAAFEDELVRMVGGYLAALAASAR